MAAVVCGPGPGWVGESEPRNSITLWRPEGDACDMYFIYLFVGMMVTIVLPPPRRTVVAAMYIVPRLTSSFVVCLRWLEGPCSFNSTRKMKMNSQLRILT